MIVTLYRGFHKDTNSTKIPVTGSYISMSQYNCELFDPCSVHSPKLWLGSTNNFFRASLNYAYIPDFERYYWVTDFSFIDGRWLMSLECDVLASFKSDIGESSQYVVRSQSKWNEDIIDTMYTPVGGKNETFDSISNPFLPSGGKFVIAYTSASPTVGSNAYGIFTKGQLITLLSYLMGNTNYLNLNLSEISDDLAKVILNPIQYIQSVKYFPFDISKGTAQTQAFFGWWLLAPTGLSFKELTLSDGTTVTTSFKLNIMRHSQAATFGNYLNLSPYSQYRLLLPCIGFIDLPAAMLYGFPKVQVTYTTDLITGLAQIDIEAIDDGPGQDRSVLVYHTTCDMAVDIPISQISTDVVGAAKSATSGVIGTVSSFLSGNIAGGISSLVNGAVDTTLSAVTPLPSFMGTAGNFNAFDVTPMLSTTFQEVSGPAFDLFGRPLCEVAQIKTLSGFTMCARAHIDIARADRAEVDEVEGFMNEGFRYE